MSKPSGKTTRKKPDKPSAASPTRRQEEFHEFHHLQLSVQCRTPRPRSALLPAIARIDFGSLFDDGVLEVHVSTPGLVTLHAQKAGEPSLRKPVVVLAFKGGKATRAKIFSSEEAADAFLKRTEKAESNGVSYQKIPTA